MNERWVCKRCFADNESTDAVCTRCGLTRGAEATATDQASWSTETATATPPPAAGWTKWLKLWWIPALAIVLVVGYIASARRDASGEIENPGSVSVTDVRSGDCFNLGEDEEISDVDGIPCSQPHLYQAFHVADHETSTFPTDAEFDAIFASVCLPRFEPFVGTSYDESVLFASMITPSQSSFDDGDREYICVLYEPDPDDPAQAVAVSGSMEGVNR